MKKLYIKAVAVLAGAILLIAFPAKISADAIIRYYKYFDLLTNTKNLESIYTEGAKAKVYAFVGNDHEENATAFSEAVSPLTENGSVFKFNTNGNIVTGIYTGMASLDYTTKAMDMQARGGASIKYRELIVNNAEPTEVNNDASQTQAPGSYQIPEFFSDFDYLNCLEGTYPDFGKTYKTGDTVEIMVTEGLGLSVGDTCFLSLDALDSDLNLVVVKAKVVGIADKGFFLPCFDSYFLNSESSVEDAYSTVHEKEMIYYPDLSEFYIYNSHFTPEETDVPKRLSLVLVITPVNSINAVAEAASQSDGTEISYGTFSPLPGGIYNSTSFNGFRNYDGLYYSTGLTGTRTTDGELIFSVFALVLSGVILVSAIGYSIGLIKKAKKL